jgi:hypothetical protein
MTMFAEAFPDSICCAMLSAVEIGMAYPAVR